MALEAGPLVAGINGLFAGCCVWVWREFAWQGINGACRMCLTLLVAARVTDWGPAPSDYQAPVGPWRWGLRVGFGFVFVYVLHHLGALITVARSASRSVAGAAHEC